MEDIAQVMLFSQGFRMASILSSKVVPLFALFKEQLSRQNHYDFGLRALKSVLVCAGGLKRNHESLTQSDEEVLALEKETLVKAIRNSVQPKLIADDVELFQGLLTDIFPKVHGANASVQGLLSAMTTVCKQLGLMASDDWLEKTMQLYQITQLHHGVMLVGDSGTGKSTSLKVLLKAMTLYDSIENQVHVFDPKVMTKDELYGTLDSTTSEWKDGIFTHTLRKIVEDMRGEGKKRHYIVFDGDVDPTWVENLNSVLDDNKILTLPNGERICLPSNVKLLFEVENLKRVRLYYGNNRRIGDISHGKSMWYDMV